MRVTVHDIARGANVSRATVHRALHSRPGISENTKQRVLLVAKHLNYKPYVLARILATRKKLQIPIVVPVDENEDFLWYQVKAGARAISYELRDVGIQTQWVVPKRWDSSNQIAVMEELIEKKVDGIALAPVDADRLRKVIDRAVDSGIPVVTFNTDAPESRRVCFVGQDLLTAGRIAGELMGELLDRKGKVLIITGFHETLAHRQRVQGFKEQLQRYFPDVEIIGIYENHDKPQEAYSISRKVLKYFSELKGIYVTAGGPFGAGQAIKDIGKVGIVKLICFDLLEETIKLIREGIIQISIQQDPFFQGYEAVRILYNYLLINHDSPQEFVFTNLAIACRGNIEILARQHIKNVDTVANQVLEKISYAKSTLRG